MQYYIQCGQMHDWYVIVWQVIDRYILAKRIIDCLFRKQPTCDLQISGHHAFKSENWHPKFDSICCQVVECGGLGEIVYEGFSYLQPKSKEY